MSHCNKPDATHHAACDCREAYFAKLEAEKKRLREALEALKGCCEHLTDVPPSECPACVIDKALKGDD